MFHFIVLCISFVSRVVIFSVLTLGSQRGNAFSVVCFWLCLSSFVISFCFLFLGAVVYFDLTFFRGIVSLLLCLLSFFLLCILLIVLFDDKWYHVLCSSS